MRELKPFAIETVETHAQAADVTGVSNKLLVWTTITIAISRDFDWNKPE